MKPMHRYSRPVVVVGLAALLGAIGPLAQAQSIQIQIPKMTERAAGGAAPAAQAGAQPAGQQPAQTSAYGSQQQPYGAGAAQQQAYGAAPQQSAYGTTQQAYGAAAPAYGSTAPSAYGGSAYGSSAYGSSGGGYGQHASGGTPQISGPMPTKPTAGGACKATVSPEKQTIILVGVADNLPRTNVPLGDFRAQTVIHAPDGRWAVAFLKLRGQPQFALFTMDLANCKEGHTADMAQAGEDATFEGDNVTVRMAGGKTQAWPLADRRVR